MLRRKTLLDKNYENLDLVESHFYEFCQSSNL